MKLKVMKAAAIFVIFFLAAVIVGCGANQNSFVKGLGPAYTEVMSLGKNVEILDPSMEDNQHRLVVFFDRCVDDDTVTLSDLELYGQTVTNFDSYLTPSQSVFNFDYCFTKSWDSLSSGAYFTGTIWASTTECESGYSDKLYVGLVDDDTLWHGMDDYEGAFAYKLVIDKIFHDSEENQSSGDVINYFIVRDFANNAKHPTLSHVYPASGSGLSGDSLLYMPMPPHSTFTLGSSEPVLNLSYIPYEVFWHDDDLHAPFDGPSIGNPSVIVRNNRKIEIGASSGMPLDIEYHFWIYSRPQNYYDVTYGPGSGATISMDGELSDVLLVSPPPINAFGKAIVLPSDSTFQILEEDVVERDVFHAGFYSDHPTYVKVYEVKGRVGPVVIDEPVTYSYHKAAYSESYLTVRATPDVDEVRITMDHWTDLIGSEMGVEITDELKPLSSLSMPLFSSTVLAPAMSRNGQYMFYWAQDGTTDNVFQVYRTDLTVDGYSTDALTSFTVGRDDAQALASHSISPNNAGDQAVFWSRQDLEDGETSTDGELYFWDESEGLFQVTTSDLFGDTRGEPNYDAVLSYENIFFFWTENSSAGDTLDHYELLRCTYSDVGGPYPIGCVNIVQGTTLHQQGINPRLSSTTNGEYVAFVSAEDWDASVGNSDYNYEIFYYGEYGVGVHQVTDSGSTVTNDYPVIADDSLQSIYFSSNGNYGGIDGFSNDGDSVSTELFVYRRLSGDTAVYNEIEQITNASPGVTVIPAGVSLPDGNGNIDVLVLSNHNFSGDTVTSGYNYFLLQPTRYADDRTYNAWGYAITTEPVIASAGDAPPLVSMDEENEWILFSSEEQLLPGDTNSDLDVYLFHYKGLEKSFTISWEDLIDEFNSQNSTNYRTEVLLPRKRHRITVHSSTAGSPGVDAIDFIFTADDDSDSDGLSDAWEIEYGYDPYIADSDSNSITDDLEDPDGDGVINSSEEDNYTNPQLADSDGDGLDDDVEIGYCTSPIDDDSDDDGLIDGRTMGEDQDNDGEVDAGETDPCKEDTDGDDLSDGVEVDFGSNPLLTDTDGDSLSDYVEIMTANTDPTLVDTDGDALGDAAEYDYCTSPSDPDSDGDGLCDGNTSVYDGSTLLCSNGEDADLDFEVDEGETNPCRADSDSDGMNDAYERQYSLDPLDPFDALTILSSATIADPDGDGVDNLYEAQNGTNPYVADSDEDGVSDLEELALGTDPGDATSNSDGDSLIDSVEVTLGTSPNSTDTDADGLSDYQETTAIYGLTVGMGCTIVPTNPDSDGDGIPDGLEDIDLDGVLDGDTETNPCLADTDGDGMDDGWEVFWGLNPHVQDGDTDWDSDGLTNLQEFLLYKGASCDALAGCPSDGHTLKVYTNPNVADSDEDGLNDGYEIEMTGAIIMNYRCSPIEQDTDDDNLSDYFETQSSGCLDPANPDTDGDGIPDGVEEDAGETDPCLADEDGDGLNDYEELLLGTDPQDDDSDDDGYNDGDEYFYMTNPNGTSDKNGNSVDDEQELINEGKPPIYVFNDMDGDGILNDGSTGEDVNGNYVVDATESDPYNMDTDGDGLPDGWELTNNLSILVLNSCAADADQDGLSDRTEYLHGTLPGATDSDSDGMPDDWEILYGLDPTIDDSTGDLDGDTLTNLQEYELSINPRSADSDIDGIRDYLETQALYGFTVGIGCTISPGNQDSDGDGIPDGLEDMDQDGALDGNTETSPCRVDTDGDLLPDGWERIWNTGPITSDTLQDFDSDGLNTLGEYLAGTNPYHKDTDHDGMDDNWEVSVGLDPLVKDAEVDSDGDGITNIEECCALFLEPYQTCGGTCDDANALDPLSSDSDGDFLGDYWELMYLHPTVDDDLTADPDSDSISNIWEYRFGTNPSSNDTDGDGLTDLQEISFDGDTSFDGSTAYHPYINVCIGGATACDLNPTLADTDHDGLSDYQELYVTFTSPVNFDTDGGGDPDGVEINIGNSVSDPSDDYYTLSGLTYPQMSVEFTVGSTVNEAFLADIAPSETTLVSLFYAYENGNTQWINKTMIVKGNSVMVSGQYQRGEAIAEWVLSPGDFMAASDINDQDYLFALPFVTAGDTNKVSVCLYDADTITIIPVCWDFDDMFAPALASESDTTGYGSFTGNFLFAAKRNNAADPSKISYDYYFPESSYTSTYPYVEWGSLRSEYNSVDKIDTYPLGLEWELSGPSTCSMYLSLGDQTWIRKYKILDYYLNSLIGPYLAYNHQPGFTFTGELDGWTVKYDIMDGYGDELEDWDSIELQSISHFPDYVKQTEKPVAFVDETIGERYHAVWKAVVETPVGSGQTRSVILYSNEEVKTHYYKDLPLDSTTWRPPILISNPENQAILARIKASPNRKYLHVMWVEKDPTDVYHVKYSLMNVAEAYGNPSYFADQDEDELLYIEELYVDASDTTVDSDGDGIDDYDEALFGLDPNDSSDAYTDLDQDGLSNLVEYSTYSSSFTNPDTDGDGMPDGWEVLYYPELDPTKGDSYKVLNNGILEARTSYILGTEPDAWDFDGDSCNDYFEYHYGTNILVSDTLQDSDGDGVTNMQECWILDSYFSDPFKPDTDEDYVDDFTEYYYISPFYDLADNPWWVSMHLDWDDTDGDGLSDGLELYALGTYPELMDSDTDDLPDGWELEYGLDPMSANLSTTDSDGDQVTDIVECNPYLGNPLFEDMYYNYVFCMSDLNPRSPDSDFDGFTDGWEVEYSNTLGFDPEVVNCNEAVVDYDGDGMAAIIEARLGTDPLLADSDGDGIDDYWEVVAGLDPLVDDAADDPDGDGRTNLEEYLNSGYFYTNPLNPDTDGDGLCDGVTTVMDGATQLCGPGEGDSTTSEWDAARLRLMIESGIGEITLGYGDTWADELEEGDTVLRLAVTSSLDAGTYTVRFDNGSGSVHEIEVAVSEGATYVIVDISDLWDDETSIFWVDIADDSGASLLDSGTTTVNLTQRLYLHYGLHSPVVATNSDGETVWRRAYLPFGGDFAGSPYRPITINNDAITHGFVGRRQDNDVGLYQLGARWYDPDLGRFVSVDPVPGFFNQYAYAYNNPFVYNDASGQAGEPGYSDWASKSSLRPTGSDEAAVQIAKNTGWAMWGVGDSIIDIPKGVLDSIDPNRSQSAIGVIIEDIIDMGESAIYIGENYDKIYDDFMALPEEEQSYYLAYYTIRTCLGVYMLAEGAKSISGKGLAAESEVAAETSVSKGPLGRGSTINPSKGRYAPRNLREKLAIDEVMANPGKGDWIEECPMGDGRWDAKDGWKKYQYVHKSPYGDVNVHYVYNENTLEMDDFKIVDDKGMKK